MILVVKCKNREMSQGLDYEVELFSEFASQGWFPHKSHVYFM